MSIRYKFFFAFSVLAALACGLALYGIRGVSTAGNLVVRLYDGPLMAINHARSANTRLNEARGLVRSELSERAPQQSIARFKQLLASIAEDFKVVAERVVDKDVTDAR